MAQRACIDKVIGQIIAEGLCNPLKLNKTVVGCHTRDTLEYARSLLGQFASKTFHALFGDIIMDLHKECSTTFRTDSLLNRLENKLIAGIMISKLSDDATEDKRLGS